MMKKYKITVDGKSYEVDVEEMGQGTAVPLSTVPTQPVAAPAPLAKAAPAASAAPAERLKQLLRQRPFRRETPAPCRERSWYRPRPVKRSKRK